jgi:hypothetical protein
MPTVVPHPVRIHGPLCCGCRDPYVVAPLEIGMRSLCVPCFLRPRTLTRIMERVIHRRGGEPCPR